MVRSVGIAAVIVGLAWTGLVLAQPSSQVQPGVSPPRERFLTVREEGRPPQRCKLLMSWRAPNGATAYKVQAVDTGELITVVSSAPANGSEQGSRVVSTRIFRWGPDNKPPAGSPVPPITAGQPVPQVRAPAPPAQPAPNRVLPWPPSPAVSQPTPAPVVSRPSAPVRPTQAPQAAATTTAQPKPNSAPSPSVKSPAPIVLQSPSTTPAARANTPSPKVSPTPSAPIASHPSAPVTTQAPQAVAKPTAQPKPNSASSPSVKSPAPIVLQSPPTKPTVSQPPSAPIVSRPSPVARPTQDPRVAATLTKLPKPDSVQSPSAMTPAPILIQSPATTPAASQPSVPVNTQVPQTAAKPTVLPKINSVPSPLVVAPAPISSKSPPTASTVSQPSSDKKNVSAAATPAAKPTIVQGPIRKPDACVCTPATSPQPRLVPMPCGTVACQPSCNTCGQPSCNTCCQPACKTCCQPSCVCCTPSPLRQSWIARLFKSNSPCDAVACKPTPAPPAAPNKPTPPVTQVAKVATEPPQPGDWRESWGKVEPWKGAPRADVAKPTNTPKPTDTPASKPVARKPAQFDPPKQPDPLKDPNWYAEMAMKKQPVNSKVPTEALKPTPTPAPEKKVVVQNTPKPLPPLPPPQTTAPTPAAQPMPPAPPAEANVLISPTQPRGQVVQVPADDPNAFAPPVPPPPTPEAQKQAKLNAFDRDDGSPPPRSAIPPMASVPQGPMPMGGPPMGAMPMPMPPMPPPMPPRPPMPSRPPMPPPMVDSGVPSGMANAFTLAASRRPIPADFGGTPQESNGFGDAVPQMVGPGSPPQPYVLPRSGMMPPPYPGMQGYPRSPMAVNPPMNGPQAAIASKPMVPGESAAGVPQLLATLKNSLYPSQREGAADQLSELNWRMQPQVVESLTKGARDDPAATVRAACVRALGHMKVNTHEVVALMQDLKNDRDARVRQQADETLNVLGPTSRQDSGVRQVSDK